MKTKFLTLIAFLLAIPTWGISVVIWFWAKFKYDKSMAKRALIIAIIESYNDGKEVILYAINNASLSMVFDMFGGRQLEADHFNGKVIGILPHPKEDVILDVIMTQTSGNKLIVKASKRID